MSVGVSETELPEPDAAPHEDPLVAEHVHVTPETPEGTGSATVGVVDVVPASVAVTV